MDKNDIAISSRITDFNVQISVVNKHSHCSIMNNETVGVPNEVIALAGLSERAIESGCDLAGAPIVMFFNIYAGDSPIRKTCNFDKPLNHILEVMDGCMHIFCLVSIKVHKIRMVELQPSPFFTDSLHEA